MNKLLTTLVFAVASTFALSGFAADSASMDHAKPAKHAAAKKTTHSAAKKQTSHKSTKSEGAGEAAAK